MHPHRRRKKRPNYGIRTVEVARGPNGFGFTISGQQPCILSCIVANSPADQAGLRPGDFLISVNGLSVSKSTHDSVVKLIGTSVGPIRMSIAEYYYSDSSDEELDTSRVVNVRKPKFVHRPRTNHRTHHNHHHQQQQQYVTVYNNANENDSILGSNSNVDVAGNNVKEASPKKKSTAYDENRGASCSNVDSNPMEYKALVGYLGTIEMPKQLLPSSRLQTVCSCIRKLRQEKRTPSTVLITVLPSCLTLKNTNNQILAIFPANRVIYVSSSSDKESRYFGLVTSGSCVDKSIEIEVSNSCHVFVTDSKIVEHSVHAQKAVAFNITCTADIITGNCLEFPKNALYVVSLVQNIYRLQADKSISLSPIVANSPQPSASSNSDSGIGFRDDYANVSDRILVVEFPAQQQQRPVPVNPASVTHRPAAIDGSVEFDLQQTELVECSVTNVRAKPSCCSLQMNETCTGGNEVRKKQQSLNEWSNRLTVRAMPDPIGVSRSISPFSSDEQYRNADIDTGQIFAERGVDVIETDELNFKTSIDNVSVHSYDLNTIKPVFKVPAAKSSHSKKQQLLIKLNSCDNLTPDDNLLNYKLSPKVYGVTKPNHSCEELSALDVTNEKSGFGSLQDLYSWIGKDGKQRRTAAISEPDVRIQRDRIAASLDHIMCEDVVSTTPCSGTGGPASWANSFEKLLDDPLGVQIFAEFLKKEFSAENIYFWTACERFKRQNAGMERTNEAQRIYRIHLCVGAPEPVNVDSQARQYAPQALQDAEPRLFEQAQKQIFNLMKFDSYPRFLKSDLYNQYLSGTVEYPQLESGLLLHPPNGTPSKLKKSLSNAEDRRRKSLLPWHRKNRSKSKDRGETEYNNQKYNDQKHEQAATKANNTQNTVHSSQSSLTSLDLAMSCSMQDCASSKGSHDEMAPCSMSGKNGAALCRVILNDGATTVVQIRPTETVRQLANRLLDKRGLNYSAYEVHIANHSKAIDLNEMSSSLVGCEVMIEQRVVFKLDLPNRKVISVKSKATKILLDVLRPILYKYGYGLDMVQVTVNGNNGSENVDVTQSVTSVDGRRLNVQLHEDTKTTKLESTPNNQKLDEITNKVFEQLLQEKSETGSTEPTTYDRGSVKSEDWGSEHSSGIFGRFLRRDSAMHERKKKLNAFRTKGNSIHSSVEDVASEQAIKKPLIAKWKSGVKLQVACSESDELYEGLKRAQRCRLEDQRGTEINFELPDFLKDKENAAKSDNKFRKLQQNHISDTHFYDNDITKQISTKTLQHVEQSKSPVHEEKFDLSSNSVSNETVTSLETNDDLNLNGRTLEPPPLPPKPKVLPIKPSNWGQNNYFKVPRTEIPNRSNERNKHILYLEQPTSSFV